MEEMGYMLDLKVIFNILRHAFLCMCMSTESQSTPAVRLQSLWLVEDPGSH